MVSHIYYTFKLMLFGDGGVGKTCLVERYVTGKFVGDTRITIGVQFLFKRLLLDGNTIDLQIWDLGGQDRFRFVFPAYCHEANGGIFSFDVTSPISLSHLTDWMEVIVERRRKFPIVVVGSKIDLNSARRVKLGDIITFTRNHGINVVMEASAKTGENVNGVFDTITRLMLKDLDQKSIGEPRHLAKY